MAEGRKIADLVVVGHLELGWLKRFRRAHPTSRSVFWSPELDNREALLGAISLAERVVVQDGLLDGFDGRIGTERVALSRFDASLAASSPDPREPQQAGGSRLTVEGGPVLFCPSNDTHAKAFDPIARQLSNAEFLLHDRRVEERAREMMESLSIDYTEGGAECLERIRPSLIVVGNDWYDSVWALFQRAYELGIPTVCIQEGCLDFADRPRMQTCDYPLMQGPIMLDHLPSHVYLLTGNPRFDELKPLPLPATPVAMGNCNFTYGVEEDARDEWVHAVADACESIGIEFFLSQHPRDRGVFPSIPVRGSHAGVVHQHLADSSILVTRFSTLVYEAMLCGRQVVYYNPHGEKMRLFNEDETGGIYVAKDPSGLLDAMRRAAAAPCSDATQRRERFLRLHCGGSSGGAARRCASALAAVARLGHPRSGSRMLDSLKMRIYRSARPARRWF